MISFVMNESTISFIALETALHLMNIKSGVLWKMALKASGNIYTPLEYIFPVSLIDIRV
jgi:hypothetical protein